MHNLKLNILLAVATTALVSLSALAEEAPAKTGKDTPARLETVIVTGQKIRRSVMDTASSVAVLDADDLRQRPGIDTMSDALNTVPNLVSVEPGNFAPAVRGSDGTGPAQGADAFFAGTRPRLNYQIDGRTLSYNESIFADATLWDVERVEIYRGPQSTLQGRNAIAGAVVTTTRAPGFEFEAGARAVMGEHDTRQYSAYASGPVIEDQLALRLAVDQRDTESFVNGFVSYPGVGDPGKFHSEMVRGKLLYQPDALPDLSALLTVNHVDAYAPQSAEVKRPFGDHDAAYPPMPRFGTRANDAILDLDWSQGEAFGVDMLLSATDLRVTRDALPGDGNAEIDAREWVVEPRVTMTLLNTRLKGFVGLHHFDNQQDEYIDLFGGGAFDDDTVTNAVFAEYTYTASDSLDVTLGGRYEREERDRQGSADIFIIDFDETYTEFLPKGSVAWRVDPDTTLGVGIARGYNGGGAGFTYEPPFESYTYDPEYVWNYELFARGEILDGTIQLTANIFYNDYEDYQLPFDLNPDPLVWSYVVRNADQATTYGAELGGRWLALPGLQIYSNVGLLETKIDKYTGSSIEGNELPRAPAYSLNCGFNYWHSSGLDLALEVRMNDSYYSDVTNDRQGETDQYWIANAQVGYSFKQLRIYTEVGNLFDSDKPVLLTPGPTSATDVALLPQPLSANVGVEYTY